QGAQHPRRPRTDARPGPHSHDRHRACRSREEAGMNETPCTICDATDHLAADCPLAELDSRRFRAVRTPATVDPIARQDARTAWANLPYVRPDIVRGWIDAHL